MSYKTILVYLPDARRAERVLDVACQLAVEHDAHLLGVHMMWPELVTPVFGVGRALLDATRAEMAANAQRLEAQFEAAGDGLAIRKEWRVLSGVTRTQSMVEKLTACARSADLIITSQRDPSWEDGLLMEFPVELTLNSGRPVLLVPNSGSFGQISSRVLVAWNDRREAARAVFDSLPILTRADDVRVLWINPERAGGPPADVPTADIVKVLARHGVKCTATEARGSDLAVGDELLNQAADHSATLIVMGAYGRWRLSEYIFGGATRHLLQHMTVPVLLSH
jgi:nucleotide-binding universal stress UspA family protein